MHRPFAKTPLLRLLSITLAAGAIGGVAVVRAGPAAVDPRGVVGLFEVPGFDFRPDGVWRPRSERIRALRQRALARHDLAYLNGTAAPVLAGTLLIPVVPIAFGNVPAPYPAAEYQDALFASPAVAGPFSLRTYYAEASRGHLHLDGVVLPWVTADSADTYYEDGCNGIGVLNSCPHGGVRLGELLLEGLRRSDDGSVDWGQFDNDGPDGIPNSGDDDGVVDVVAFLQPEVDGACGTTNLWAHRFDVSVWNGGSPYVTSSPRRGAGGVPIPGSHILVRDYTLQSGVGGTGACSGAAIMPIGTLAHEVGHAFGLPDLYDTDLRSASVTQGVGEWSLMGSGNYSQPYSPSAMDPWSLGELGWVAIDTLGQSGPITLAPVATSDTVLLRLVAGTDEYFLFENRQPIGTDSAQFNPLCQFGTRSCAKSPGLLIWHIDQGQISAHGFRQDNAVNSGPVHGVAVIQADGRNDLRTPGTKNRGDLGDAWPGISGATLFSEVTNPPALDNEGRSAGITLDSIRQLVPGGPVAFRLTLAPPGAVIVSFPTATDAILGRTLLGSAQIAYLDSLGNTNGQYDVGDFLAFYRRQVPATARSGRP
ncbi:MAG TPA: M6 family metalloprotease domain-containing protein [Gemmatimonadales bacterium]|nr:M6 family metalloprotease domain-containing protein [Gemmatimonadales bacterium]